MDQSKSQWEKKPTFHTTIHTNLQTGWNIKYRYVDKQAGRYDMYFPDTVLCNMCIMTENVAVSCKYDTKVTTYI